MTVRQVTSDAFEESIARITLDYIRNDAAISEIVREIRRGGHCAIIIVGPRYCQKSLLLRDAKATLESQSGAICALIDLKELAGLPDIDFFRGFAQKVSERTHQITGDSFAAFFEQVEDELSLQNWLGKYVNGLGRDLILLIDHLEHIQVGAVESLLNVLRALYNLKATRAAPRLMAVTAASLDIAPLAHGPTSPFHNIAHRIWVRDLSPEESNQLINIILKRLDLEITVTGRKAMVEATNGDRYLIPRLCDYCAKLADEKAKKKITGPEVNRAIKWFVDHKADSYPPLQETVRSLEANPVTLMNLLKILEQGKVQGKLLRLNIDQEIDDLQLSGATRIDTEGDSKVYLIRNEIYNRYLTQHFHPERVVSVLSMAGEWDEAIRFLERIVPKSPQNRSTLLATIIGSVYAAPSEMDACRNLAHRLSKAFSIPKISIHVVNPERTCLKLVSQIGFEDMPIPSFPLEDAEQPEVMAFFSRHYKVAENENEEQKVLIPILRDGREPWGVATVYSFDVNTQGDDFLRLLAFLKQVGRAIGSVIRLSTFYETGKQVTSSLGLEQVMQAAVDAAIRAVPGAERGALFLWDEREEKLMIGAHRDYRKTVADEVKLESGKGYVGSVYQSGNPIRIDNVSSDPRVLLKDDPDISKQKSVICVPLQAWGRVIGVLLVDNTAIYHAFQDSDLALLSTFAAQAAIAIQNARLYTELYDLGMRINQGYLEPEGIFRHAVESMIRVSGARAANMLLLRDTDEPQLSASQRIKLSISSTRLGSDYDKKIEPRPDGLTYQVLRDKEPRWVSSTEDQPGINNLARESGTQAYVCLPLKIKGEVIGVLFVHYEEPHTFSNNEIRMLSLFANQAALAIENARQREELALTDEVAWMGLLFPSLAHRVKQKTGAIKRTVWKARELVEQKRDICEIVERLDRIKEYVNIVGEIHSDALELPFQKHNEHFDLKEMLLKEIPQWCRREDGIETDFSELRIDGSRVYADRKRLAIVLETLATNAVRAMESAKIKEFKIAGEVRGLGQKRRAVVYITNNGKGIPEQVHSHLFKSPVRKAGSDGAGVGLLIARRIMRRYCGDVELVLSESERTTFSFWLPIYSEPY